MKRLGLVINPIAGLGGKVGLKGSDGWAVQAQARALGAIPEALNRTVAALKKIQPIAADIEVITFPGEMGAAACQVCGLEATIIGVIQPGQTTGNDTRRAAEQMMAREVSLLLFAGGDGTARDVYTAVGEQQPALGIPAGVKIHSAVFGVNPDRAGELARAYLEGKSTSLRKGEVLDIDEQAYWQGVISAKLYGYLQVPFRIRMIQSQKSASQPGENALLDAIACRVVEQMEPDSIYLVGPGTTTRAITDKLGLEKTLLGVDAVINGGSLAMDVNEMQILKLIEGRPAKIILAPIGGQGFLLGRGNQQISAKVIQQIGRDSQDLKDHILVVSTPDKINALKGRPLLVDTGDKAVDQRLAGYIKLISGYDEAIIYKVSD